MSVFDESKMLSMHDCPKFDLTSIGGNGHLVLWF